MKKKYFIRRGNFANSYQIISTRRHDAIDGWERITRKEAERLTAEERYRRRYDQAFSGFASAEIEDYDDDLFWEEHLH